MIIEERDYRIKPGKIGKFVSTYEQHGLPIQKELLGTFLGYFTTEIGELNHVVALWGYEGLDDRLAVAQPPAADGLDRPAARLRHGGQVDQAGADHAIPRVDHLVGGKFGRGVADRDHGLTVDVQIEAVIDAVCRVDQAAIEDADAHGVSPDSVFRSDCDCIAIDITAIRTAMP